MADRRGLGVHTTLETEIDLPAVMQVGEVPQTGHARIGEFAALTEAGKTSSETRLLQQRDVRERFTALGFEPSRGSPAQFGALIKSDIVKWEKVVRESGARVD